ncbi:MAG: DoxX family membrane protein [Candidatus Marinimicrobia bacterium]|nr:DoxX family membrane protein [Candidatus Neomarinimicrobiota bacterium]MCH8024212.1 DoxX family membrane protein [Candidatus Neomarinimicrobiota bacterium]
MQNRRTLVILLALRLFVGLFWLENGLNKISAGWLSENKLKPRLVQKSLLAQGVRGAYLDNFAVPASRGLGILVAVGELAVGIAFLAGFWMKPAAWGAIFLVLNIKFAFGDLLTLEILSSSSFFPLLLATLAAGYIDTGKQWTIMRFAPFMERFDVR